MTALYHKNPTTFSDDFTTANVDPYFNASSGSIDIATTAPTAAEWATLGQAGTVKTLIDNY